MTTGVWGPDQGPDYGGVVLTTGVWVLTMGVWGPDYGVWGPDYGGCGVLITGS